MKNPPAPRHQIAHKDDVPDWMVHNEFLFSGYRKGFNCLRSSFKSLFYKHNETMNVWTHLLAAVAFVVLLGYLACSFEQNKAIYSEIKAELNFGQFSSILQESSGKIAQAFKELDLKDNFETLKQNLWSIKKMQLDFLESAKEKFISEELSLIKTFNGQMDKLILQAEGYFNDCMGSLRDFRSSSAENFKELLGTFEEAVSGRKVIAAFNRILDSELEFFPVVLFFLSAIACLGFSATFHLFYVMNPRVCKVLQKLDYAGISILIFGSAFNIYFYFFYCEPGLRLFYCAAIGLACLAVFLVSLSDWIDRPEAIGLKGLIYGLLGVSNLLPLGHMVLIAAAAKNDARVLPLWEISGGILAEGVCYLGGLAFYVFKFPERCFPKRFDIWLNSHVVWHLCVVGGAVAHLGLTMRLYALRAEHHCF